VGSAMIAGALAKSGALVGMICKVLMVIGRYAHCPGALPTSRYCTWLGSAPVSNVSNAAEVFIMPADQAVADAMP